jgi:hypothetical protein
MKQLTMARVLNTRKQTDRKWNRQIDKQNIEQTKNGTDKYINRQIDKQTYIQMYKCKDGQKDKQKE